MAAVSQGADIHELCRAGGIKPTVFEHTDARISLQQNCAIMEEALRLTGNPVLGLDVGENTTVAIFGLLGHLLDSSPNLLDALEYVCKYLQTVSNIYEYRLQRQDDELYFFTEPIPAWYVLSPVSARMSVEISLAGFVQGFSRMQGRPVFPLRAMVRHERPEEVREYWRLMGADVRFEQDANGLVFRVKDLASPLRGYNPAIHSLFLEVVEKQIAQTTRKESFANEVRRTILRYMGTQFPHLSDVATFLHLTPRTLQRKLQDEGAAFQTIADSIRSDMAIDLLRNPQLTVNEVAYKLGYAEPSVFRRAFKKWTGSTPGELRRQ